MRAVLVLPLVPVMWMTGAARCTSPRISTARRTASSREPSYFRGRVPAIHRRRVQSLRVRDCWVAHLAHSVLSLAGIKLCGQRLYQDSALCTDIYIWVYSHPSTVHTAVCYMCWGGLEAILPLFYAAFATLMVRLSPSVRSRETARVSPVTSSSWARRASKVSCGALTVRLMRSETFSPASLRAC